MKRKHPFPVLYLVWLALALFVFPAGVQADDEDSGRTFGKMQGVPASVAIGGGGLLPAGHAITALNFSFRDKYESVTGEDLKTNRNVDNTTIMNLLKLRYGVTDRVEVQAVIPYVFFDPASGRNRDSWGDITVSGVYGFLQEKFGDPVSLALSLRAGLPTGSMGPDALPGGGAWSGQTALSMTKTWGLNQVVLDIWGAAPFEEGNQHVRKGNSYGLNYKYAYALTQYLDAGIEGTIEHAATGKRLGTELKNDYTEWYTGPAMTYNIPGTNIDLCIGAYLPVYREYGQNTSSDSVRVDGKLFLVW